MRSFWEPHFKKIFPISVVERLISGLFCLLTCVLVLFSVEHGIVLLKFVFILWKIKLVLVHFTPSHVKLVLLFLSLKKQWKKWIKDFAFLTGK